MPRGESRISLPQAHGLTAEQHKGLQSRVEAALGRIGAVEEYRAEALRRLVEYARKERVRIEGSDRTKLDQYRAAEKKSRRENGIWSRQQRMARKVEYVRYAQSLGVDTDKLFRLNAYTRLRASLLNEGLATTNFRLPMPDPEGDSFDQNCVTYTPPYANTFHTSFSSITGDGELEASESYLDDPTSVCGGRVRIRNWDADGNDTGLAYQENGFTACYRTRNAPAMAKIRAKFQCVESANSLSTEDEWGWSDSGIIAKSFARFAVYLDTVGDLDYTEAGLSWSRYEGDGESENNEARGQIAVRRLPGQVVTVSALSANVLPANTNVGVYVGTRVAVDFWVDDVSVDATARGKWHLQEFRVCQM